MNYANQTIDEASPEVLLHALIEKSGGLSPGPSKTVYSQTVLECLVGIGKDHTATIRLHEDEARVLNERVAG